MSAHALVWHHSYLAVTIINGAIEQRTIWVAPSNEQVHCVQNLVVSQQLTDGQPCPEGVEGMVEVAL
jgi:hypothetical protein